MSTLTLSPIHARRLAVSAQLLDGSARADGDPHLPESLLAVMQRLRCLQLDPIRAIERTQYLVLWSRLGHYDREHLHQLVYSDRHFFEYWAHAASIVLTEDYPLHELMMREYGETKAGGRNASAGSRRQSEWVAANGEFRDYILHELEMRGPLLAGDLEDRVQLPWKRGVWTSGRSVAYMLDYLWSRGEVLVAQRDGLKRWWDLSSRVLPTTTPAGGWSPQQVTRSAAEKSLRALGIAQPRDVARHFIEGRYPHLDEAMTEMEDAGVAVPVAVGEWRGEWYVHRDHLPLLGAIQRGEWRGQTTLLSPFDNLIRDRERTELLWDFYYRIEIYVPKAKREYGYYVLPILHDERLIGRVDAKMDRKRDVLDVHNVYREAGIDFDEATKRAVGEALERLGLFLKAKAVDYGEGARWLEDAGGPEK